MFRSRLTICHVAPASSDRQSSPSSVVSLITYTVAGLLLDTATPMRSIGPFGRPRLASGPDRRVHVAPPSTDLWTAVSPPPDSVYQAQRRNVNIPAYTMFALVGSISTSEQPVRSFW